MISYMAAHSKTFLFIIFDHISDRIEQYSILPKHVFNTISSFHFRRLAVRTSASALSGSTVDTASLQHSRVKRVRVRTVHHAYHTPTPTSVSVNLASLESTVR